MGANRVGGANPGDPKGPDTRTQQEQHRKIEKVEKVRQVDEAENERARKKFRSFMDDDETDEKKTKPSPSPFEIDFHKAEQEVGSIFDEITKPIDDLEDLETKVIDDPRRSRPPSVQREPTAPQETSSPLPRNQEFWQKTDTSSDHSSQHPDVQESSHAQKEDPKKKIKHAHEDDIISGKEHKDQKHPQKIVKDKKEVVTAAPIDEEKQVRAAPMKAKEEEEKIAPTSKKAKEKERAFSPLDPESHQAHRHKDDKDEEEKGKQAAKEPQMIEIDSPTMNQLPQNVVPIAQAATLQATPYLNSEISPLFFQMVGTIYVMKETNGVSKTEIDLNSPSFANSRFFGSKIMIEKYATAPDSLNIRLTGPDEAVKSFNQNLSNLYSAFENGKFDFQIGRITAEYSTDRPVYKRKDGREKGSGGGDFSGDKQNK